MKKEYIIKRLTPHITTVSEMLKSKQHAEQVIIGGKIESILYPIDYEGEVLSDKHTLFINDDLGTIVVEVTNSVFERDKGCIYEGNIVLIKGVVKQFVKTTRGYEIGREYRVVAISVVPLSLAEEKVGTGGEKSKCNNE